MGQQRLPGVQGLAGKTIIWLYVGPRSMQVVKEYRDILQVQGIRIEVPKNSVEDLVLATSGIEKTSVIVADPGTARRIQNPGWANLVVQRDPLSALFKALAHPKKSFQRIIIGIDPGNLCAVSVIADETVIHASKTACEDLPELLSELMSKIPHETSRIYIGSGPGSDTIVHSLAVSGFEARVIDETGTTKTSIKGARTVKDKDLEAAIRIARLGALNG
ncbi:MAG: hypothetical protein F7C07_05605 [Desulfurococcales archaeon]|nr:hypothetical protein [Desulfurococcales archaeon]